MGPHDQEVGVDGADETEHLVGRVAHFQVPGDRGTTGFFQRANVVSEVLFRLLHQVGIAGWRAEARAIEAARAKHVDDVHVRARHGPTHTSRHADDPNRVVGGIYRDENGSGLVGRVLQWC